MVKLFSFTAFVFYGVALFGLVMHAVVRWSNGEIEGNLADWFLVNKKATVKACLAALGATAGLILAGTVADFNIPADILAVWGVSYFMDSKLNNQKEGA